MCEISKEDEEFMRALRRILVAGRKMAVIPTKGVTEIPLKTGVLHIPEGVPCITTCDIKEADNAGVMYIGGKTEYIIFLTNADGLSEENCKSACTRAEYVVQKGVKDPLIFGIVEEDKAISHYTYGLKIVRDRR